MWRQRARTAAPRALAVASAVVFTVFAFLYSPTAVAATTQSHGIQIRIWLLVAFVIVSAVSTWMLVVGQQGLLVKVAVNLSCGFNLIWIFSFIGPPVVLASVVAAGLATVPAPRGLLPVLVGSAVAGFCLGLLVLQIR